MRVQLSVVEEHALIWPGEAEPRVPARAGRRPHHGAPRPPLHGAGAPQWQPAAVPLDAAEPSASQSRTTIPTQSSTRGQPGAAVSDGRLPD